MTREEAFIFRWIHEWRGLLLDPKMHGLRGSELSLYLKQLEHKLNVNLAAMFHDAQPSQPATNGTPAQPRRPA